MRAPRLTWDADTAVEQLYAAHWRQLVRLSVLLVRDQAVAEEVVQDSFVALHGRWSRLAEPEKALAYLRQTVVNRSRSVLRRRGTEARYLHQVPPREEAGTEDTAEGHERRVVVLEALRRLPARQREVVALRYYLDLSEADIAATLGISRGAVKSHGSRALAALGRTLGHLMEDAS
jgi:RNA polymerase sigma-70 factor (sigma-E family)